MFSFTGTVSPSKSLMNRALVTKSYFSSFNICGNSQCEDVKLMREAVEYLTEDMRMDRPISCGSSGSVLRFLALRVSREKGIHKLSGSSRLMKRLPNGLLSLLSQLGCEVCLKKETLTIKSSGWKFQGDGIYVPTSHSSQFASALLLNSWKLDRELNFSIEKKMVSQSYFLMTKKLLKSFGLRWIENQNEFRIGAHQELSANIYTPEIDLSSAFSIAVLAALLGEAYILKFPKQSLQPDACFINILSQIGILLEQDEKGLRVLKSHSLKPLSMSVVDCPDLFPCLSVLLAFANGKSTLTGISNLKNKESDRVDKTYELLTKCNVKIKKTDTYFEIFGPINTIKSGSIDIISNESTDELIDASSIKPFDYHSENDHRMAMAAGVLQKCGAPIRIEDPESVNKSFPEFWDILSMVK